MKQNINPSDNAAMTQNTPSVFISYGSPDQARVLPFYDYLHKQGFNVWIDSRDDKPGQN
jgi:hypothetical protein